MNQTQESLFWGVFWRETHTTKWYYDKVHVWATVAYRGLRGYHACNNPGSGIGYDVQVTSCVVYNVQPNTYRLQSYDYYKLVTFGSGFPITASHAMHINIYPSGAWYAHYDY